MHYFRVNALSKSFGTREVLRNIHFYLKKGTINGLMGSNGSGKTTLLRILAGMELPDHGHVKLGRGPMRDISDALLPGYAEIMLVDQSKKLRPNFSVYDILRYEARNAADPENLIDPLIQLFKLEDLLNRTSANLSGGEIQRVALAQQLIHHSPVILLDEPFEMLDPLTREVVMDAIREWVAARKITLLFSSHQWPVIQRFANKLLILEEGKISQQASPLRVYQSPASLHAARLTGLLNPVSQVTIKHFFRYNGKKQAWIRPERVAIASTSEPHVGGLVINCTHLPPLYWLEVEIDRQRWYVISTSAHKPNQKLKLSIHKKDLLWF